MREALRDAMAEVRDFRRKHGDAFYFNWRLAIPVDFQKPFEATHQSMSELRIDEDMAPHELAAALRRVFSGIVSGNVREETIELIEQQGPFTINGSARIMGLLDKLPILKSEAAGTAFQALIPLLSGNKSAARLRMTTYRGKPTATMVYDNLPINDVFHKVDEDTVLGIMDLKGMKQPFFFVLRREK